MRARALLAGLLVALVAALPASARAEPDSVVLLHGLWHTERNMHPLASYLSEQGFQVHNLHYPSDRLRPEALVTYLDEQLTACCANAARLHFVAHSLGGILVRAYLAEHLRSNLGRVVLLAPPNGGSELVDLARKTAVLAWILGPTGVQLGTDAGSLPNRLPPPEFEVGIIAGTRSRNPLFKLLLPGESDGKVSVASARLAGMSDFVTVPATHKLIVRSEVVAEYVAAFLRDGRFGAPSSVTQ